MSWLRWFVIITMKISWSNTFDYSFKSTFMGACGQHRSQTRGFYKEARKVRPSTKQGEEIALQQIFGNSFVVGQRVSMETALKKFHDQSIISSKINPYLAVFVKALSNKIHIAGPMSLSSGIAKAAWKLTEAVKKREQLLRKKAGRQNVENQITQRDIRFLFLLWANCRKQLTSEDFRLCQQQAYGTIEASAGNFLPFYETMDEKDGKLNRPLNENEVSALELSLLSLRDYVVLNIMTLKSMLETEKDRFRAKFAAAYKKALKSKTSFYLQYTIKAIRAVSKYYKTFPNSCSGDKIVCDSHETFVKPGGKTKYFTSECRCVLVPQLAPRKCHVTMTVVRDHVSDPSYDHRTRSTNDIDEVIKEFATGRLEEKQLAYRNDACKTVEEFWEKELLDTVKMAHKLVYDNRS